MRSQGQQKAEGEQSKYPTVLKYYQCQLPWGTQANPRLGVQVIYGDTDSIMVATGAQDLQEAGQLAGRIKREVNKRYRLLEIEEDGLFKRMLLLKKKKYAALKLVCEPDGSWSEVRPCMLNHMKLHASVKELVGSEAGGSILMSPFRAFVSISTTCLKSVEA